LMASRASSNMEETYRFIMHVSIPTILSSYWVVLHVSHKSRWVMTLDHFLELYLDLVYINLPQICV